MSLKPCLTLTGNRVMLGQGEEGNEMELLEGAHLLL